MNERASDIVYHYTDSARLPFILLDGKLRAGRNRIGGYPDPDFLWATTSPVGDRTASASIEACRAGRVRLVRFILLADAFEPWRAIITRFPAWTPQQVAGLETAAAGKSRPQDWRCRAEPLPAGQWLGIETRSYTDKTWRPLPIPRSVMPFGHSSFGIQIGNKVYVSTQREGPLGLASYAPVVLDAEAAA
ncbi:hypothetical protein MKL09_13940 [Methylobacterium sp. J-048]|uniref:hypothetical protein n=1 Tax=Methylobacterium sp. J-048 TaxID=2836635 RepID=UPI001FBBD040|nr:hypothetical protein [Methylobacterium sp. J-048]MCJ2057654.1 hypothetical protein [Methylobacterium sp. J-048]